MVFLLTQLTTTSIVVAVVVVVSNAAVVFTVANAHVERSTTVFVDSRW